MSKAPSPASSSQLLLKLITLTFLGKAKKDATDEIDVFLGLIPANDWKASIISIGYLPEDTNKNPIHVDGIIIFANGALSEDDHNVTQTILSYIGVSGLAFCRLC